MDVETMVLHAGLRLLSQIPPSARRRVLSYWCARAEYLPLINGKGDVLSEQPVDDDPPIIRFINAGTASPIGGASSISGAPEVGA